MKTEIKIKNNKKFANFNEPYIIAEIGANHNGDIDLAKKMIDSAVECGADAVKFQSWTPTTIVSNDEYKKNQKYNDSAKKHFGSLEEMVKRYYLREEQHFELKKYCEIKNVDFCSSHFSKQEADLLNMLDVPFFKLASMDINNIPLLEHTAEYKKPIVISTGMSTISEIEKAIKAIESKNNYEIVILHCISIYPPEYKDINLRNITMLQQTFGYPVGFSDHTIGYSIPLAAVSLGACIVEKHFTLDKSLPGWDHEISADPTELQIICKESKNIINSLGSYIRTVSDQEEKKKKTFRRSAFSINTLNAGHIIEEKDLKFLRPGNGFGPDKLEIIVGRTLKNKIHSDQMILPSDLI